MHKLKNDLTNIFLKFKNSVEKMYVGEKSKFSLRLSVWLQRAITLKQIEPVALIINYYVW